MPPTRRSRGTACKLRLQVPSALRAPAAPHLYVRLAVIYTITKYLLIMWFATSILFGGYIYATRKSFDLALSLLASENFRHKGLSKFEVALLKGIRLSRLSVIVCVAIIIFVEIVGLARL